ncbi:MAG: gamma-glutamyltransferase [Actinomycetota bacterium]
MLPPAVTRHAPNAMVSTIDHLATEAGVDLLRKGGSAVDAAIGANAVLSVTCPNMCGMGGDLWALIHHTDGAPEALDASGRAGSGADPDRARAEGLTAVPMKDDIRSVTVPAAVDGWLAMHARHGRLDLATVFADAIRFAEHGFPIHPTLSATLDRVAGVEHNDLPAAARPGTMITRPGSARTLRAIAEQGRAGFYLGEFGEGLLAAGPDEYGPADLEIDQARWVDPISVRAFGHDIWSVPPTSQGYLTLLSAAIVDGFEFDDDGRGTHLLVEAAIQAGHDRPTQLFDGADPAVLLSPERIAERRAAIDPDRAGHIETPSFDGDTTYLCVIDGDGMGVSLINSNASGFGAHLVAGSSGIFLHDRGLGFSLEPGHPAEYRPGMRPPHTLAPALVTHPDGRLRTVLGTMGGDAQPQVVLQMLAASLAHGRSAGNAVGRPRWRIAPAVDTGFSTWAPGVSRKVELEDGVPQAVADALAERGHELGTADHSQFGHAHLIEITEFGSLAGAADPRALAGAATGI